jgi:hypothetical protein
MTGRLGETLPMPLQPPSDPHFTQATRLQSPAVGALSRDIERRYGARYIGSSVRCSRSREGVAERRWMMMINELVRGYREHSTLSSKARIVRILM